MLDFPIVDSHVHLLDPGRFGYAWTKGAPSLNRLVLPADLFAAAKPVEIDRFVFVEVDVDYPQHLAEAAWVAELARTEPRLKGMVAALPLEKGNAIAGELEELAGNPVLRAVRRLIQNQPDPDFCIRPDFIAGLKLFARTTSPSTSASSIISCPNVSRWSANARRCASSSTISASRRSRRGCSIPGGRT